MTKGNLRHHIVAFPRNNTWFLHWLPGSLLPCFVYATINPPEYPSRKCCFPFRFMNTHFPVGLHVFVLGALLFCNTEGDKKKKRLRIKKGSWCCSWPKQVASDMTLVPKSLCFPSLRKLECVSCGRISFFYNGSHSTRAYCFVRVCSLVLDWMLNIYIHYKSILITI